MKGVYCFQCHDDLTLETDGIQINTDMYQCDDCHYNEFGYRITCSLLVMHNLKAKIIEVMNQHTIVDDNHIAMEDYEDLAEEIIKLL